MKVEPPSLEKSIKTRFAAVLRSDGFSGSGRTFRRTINGIICIVQFQGSRAGGSFAVNLGLQPVAILDEQETTPGAKKLSEADCEFRRRLAANGGDQWWSYSNQLSLDAALDDALHVYTAVGRHAFALQTGSDAPLYTITPQAFAEGRLDLSGFKTTNVRIARALALMRLADGRTDDAIAFAKLALEVLGQASGLRRELEVIANGP